MVRAIVVELQPFPSPTSKFPLHNSVLTGLEKGEVWKLGRQMVGPAVGPPALASTRVSGNMKRERESVYVWLCVCAQNVCERLRRASGWMWTLQECPARTPWVAVGFLPMEAGLYIPGVWWGGCLLPHTSFTG